MSIKPSWRFIQLVLLIGCGYVFRLSDCLVLNAINGHTFSPNASAEFECIIDPYTNSQTWFVDSVSVADCGIIVCSENASNPERYSFRPNTSAGHFIFKINQILLEDNDDVIRCFDGTTFKETSISVTVDDNGGGGGGDGGGGGIASEFLIIIVFFVIFSIIIIIIAGIAVYKKSHPRACSSHITSFKKTTRTLRPANAEVTSAPQYEAHLEQPMHGEQSVDIKAKIEVWMNDPGNCCIIMKWLLRIGVLLEEIVKQTGILLKESDKKRELWDEIQEEEIQRIVLKEQTQHHFTVGQRKQEKELMQKRLEWITKPSWMEVKNLEGNGTDAVSKMKKLVDNTTFSVFVMKGFVKEKPFFDYMISKLQENRKIYENIEQEIALKTRAKDVERENWQYR